MSYRTSNAQEYEQSLQEARASLLNSTFEKFWLRADKSFSFTDKESSSSSISTTASPSSWYNHVKSQYKIVSLTLLTATLLLLSLPFIMRARYQADRFLHQCSSLACIATSHRIIENLNLNIDPCDNFYSYACGGWMKTHFLTPSETSVSYFKEIYKKNLISLYQILQTDSNSHSESINKSKVYFHSCMDTSNSDATARKTLLNILDETGLSPVLSNNWSTEKFDLVASLANAHQHKINAIFRMGITIDDKNNSYHRIYFDQSGLSFDERYHYNDQTVRYLFNQFGVQLLKHLHSSVPLYQIAEHIDEIYLFEKRLVSIFQSKKSTNPFKLYHSRTYPQVRAWFSPWFDIEHYLQRMFNRDASFFSNQTFLISTPNYFEQLNRIVQTTPTHILANYITFQVIQELLPYMPESFTQTRRPLLAYLKGITEEKQLWEICVKRTDEAFGFATGALFVSKVFSAESRERIEHIVEEIRWAFVETLPDIQWMDSATRQQAQLKAKMIIDRLGYPKWLEEQRNVDQYYQDLILSSSNNSVINVMLVRRFQKEQNLKKLNQRPDLEEWTMTPVDVNAYYAPWKNMIVFPAGILQTPFFDPNMPISLNFGSIASIIGHELIHAFDASGRYFDGYGNLNNWWHKGSARSFNEHAQCFIDQYTQYHLSNRHVNGFLTLDENIADNGGLRIAYTAYKRYLKRHHLFSMKRWKSREQRLLPGLNLTDEQMFFVGFAQTWCTKTTPQTTEAALVTDTHAPAQYRVIGSLSNMPEFSSAFTCPERSPMNSEKPCQIWLTSSHR